MPGFTLLLIDGTITIDALLAVLTLLAAVFLPAVAFFWKMSISVEKLAQAVADVVRENNRDHEEFKNHQEAQDGMLREHDQDIATIKAQIRAGA